MRDPGCVRALRCYEVREKEGNVKSSRIIRTLLAWAFSMVPGPSAVFRSRKNLSGGDYPERGSMRGWVIFAVLAVVVIAGLLTIAGPPLSAIFNMFMERAGR